MDAPGRAGEFSTPEATTFALAGGGRPRAGLYGAAAQVGVSRLLEKNVERV